MGYLFSACIYYHFSQCRSCQKYCWEILSWLFFTGNQLSLTWGKCGYSSFLVRPVRLRWSKDSNVLLTLDSGASGLAFLFGSRGSFEANLWIILIYQLGSHHGVVSECKLTPQLKPWAAVLFSNVQIFYPWDWTCTFTRSANGMDFRLSSPMLSPHRPTAIGLFDTFPHILVRTLLKEF